MQGRKRKIAPLTETNPVAAKIKAKITEVRASRKAAAKDGGHTAVSTLHRLEFDILTKLADMHVEKPKEEPFAGLSDAEQVTALLELVMSLPPDVQTAVRDALTPPSVRLIGGAR